MKLSALKRLRCGKRGLSLVEVVVSLALLSLIVVMLFAVLMVSMNTIYGNAGLKKQDAEAAEQIEKDFAGLPETPSAIEREDATFSIDFDGVVVGADGKILNGSDQNNDSEFKYFEPK